MADMAVEIAELAISAPPGDDWLSAEDLAALTPKALVDRLRALAPLAAAHAREAERARRPADVVWNALRRSGLFYLLVPKRFGGLEFDIETFIDAILPIARGCASTAWLASFCVEHNWMLGHFPLAAQEEIFGISPYIIAPATTSPPGRAMAVPGGFRLSGQWKWGTGVMNADWIMTTGLLADTSPPALFMFVFPASEARVLDTWHVDGMAATGSNDIAVDDLFVPTHRAARWDGIREGRSEGSKVHDNPIFRAPVLPFLGMTALIPAVGAALNAVELYRLQLSQRAAFGTDVKMAERPAAQIRLARADQRARSAEIILRATAAEIIALGRANAATDVVARGRLRAQLSYAMGLCREAIQIVAEGAGSSAHHLDNPIQRALRDVNVMASHVVFDDDQAAEQHGRLMLGLQPNSPLT